jgi:stage II sporulation protein GA (sporulation sigma-E factor processing peptidase)
VEIYLDVVFAVNFVMDTFVLWLAGRLAGRGKAGARLWAGGGLMALLYCLLLFVENLKIYQNLFAAVLIVMLGCLAAFRPRGALDFLKLVALAHGAAFALGGMGMALFYWTHIGDWAGHILGLTVTRVSVGLLAVTTGGAYGVLKICALLRRRAARRRIFPVTIHYAGADASLPALLDSGNLLKDPLSGAPVVVVEFGALRGMLPQEVCRVFEERNEEDLGRVLGMVDGPVAARFRMIPYESLGKQHGMLLGFRPDRVEIGPEGVGYDHVVVGIYNRKLSRDNTYQGLLSAELL